LCQEFHIQGTRVVVIEHRVEQPGKAIVTRDFFEQSQRHVRVPTTQLPPNRLTFPAQTQYRNTF
jgi:hypothetical protein